MLPLSTFKNTLSVSAGMGTAQAHTHTGGALVAHVLGIQLAFCPHHHHFSALLCMWPQTVRLNLAHFKVKWCSKQNLTSTKRHCPFICPGNTGQACCLAHSKFINLHPRKSLASSSNAHTGVERNEDACSSPSSTLPSPSVHFHYMGQLLRQRDCSEISAGSRRQRIWSTFTTDIK